MNFIMHFLTMVLIIALLILIGLGLTSVPTAGNNYPSSFSVSRDVGVAQQHEPIHAFDALSRAGLLRTVSSEPLPMTTVVTSFDIPSLNCMAYVGIARSCRAVLVLEHQQRNYHFSSSLSHRDDSLFSLRGGLVVDGNSPFTAHTVDSSSPSTFSSSSNTMSVYDASNYASRLLAAFETSHTADAFLQSVAPLSRKTCTIDHQALIQAIAHAASAVRLCASSLSSNQCSYSSPVGFC